MTVPAKADLKPISQISYIAQCAHTEAHWSSGEQHETFQGFRCACLVPCRNRLFHPRASTAPASDGRGRRQVSEAPAGFEFDHEESRWKDRRPVESPDSPRNTQLLAYGLPKITETIWFVQFDCQDHTFTSSAQSSVVTTTQVSLLGSTVLPGRYGIATRQPKKS